MHTLGSNSFLRPASKLATLARRLADSIVVGIQIAVAVSFGIQAGASTQGRPHIPHEHPPLHTGIANSYYGSVGAEVPRSFGFCDFGCKHFVARMLSLVCRRRRDVATAAGWLGGTESEWRVPSASEAFEDRPRPC